MGNALGEYSEVLLMNSSFIGKVDKARKYAEEKERVSITTFKANFHGNHGSYEVTFDSGNWECQCEFFARHPACSHTMALQRILDEVLARGVTASEVH